MKTRVQRPQQSRTALCATDRQGSLLAHLQPRRLDRFAYTPFGHRPPATGMGFNGERPDPQTGHYLLGNGYRAYNPVLMRFNSPDSLSPFGEGGINAYAYCAGDPLNRHDSTGHLSSPHLLRMTMSRPAPLTRPLHFSGLGSLDIFVGTPHVLYNIVGRLPGDDLVSFSLASSAARKVVLENIKPLVIQQAADELGHTTISTLRAIALGQAPRHIPEQVLKWKNLKEMALQTPETDIPMQVLQDKLNYVRDLQRRQEMRIRKDAQSSVIRN
ncbi:RHS repeat-associated core domain-containing protein [Pseudomonas syringae]